MVKSSERRKRKYEDKIDADVLKTQTEKLKPSMVKHETEYFREITNIEEIIKKIVEAEGATPLQVRDYLNYGREIFRLSTKFSKQTLNAEAQLRLNKWADRGLDSNLLVKIANTMGADPSPTPSPIQEVDVTDRPERELGRTEVKNFPLEYPIKTREDLISYGSVASPNNNGALLIAGSEGMQIKVYDAGYHAGVDGLHYFYFGTSTSPTTKRFCTMNKALPMHKTFVCPRVSEEGDSLYLYSSVNDINIPYDLGYVKE